MKIEYLSDQKIIFKGMQGELRNHNKDFLEFVNNACNIDTTQYDYIYILDDGWAGHLLLIQGNKYRCIRCGSGRPLLTETETTGIIENM